MSDLLPRRPYPLVLPPTGGFEDAVRRARLRRRRQTAGAGASVTMVLLAAVSYTMLNPTNATNSLQVTEPGTVETTEPRPGTSQSPDPARSPGQPPVTPTARDITGWPGTGTEPRAGDGSGVTPTGGPGGLPTARPTSSRPGGSFTPPRAPMSEGEEIVGFRPCMATEASQPLCAVVETQDGVDNRELRLAVCRPPSHGSGVHLTYGSALETDFEVYYGSTLVWRWSDTQRFGAPRNNYSVDPGECVEWTTTWGSVDDRNNELRRGESYRLVGISKAKGYGVTAERSFTA